MKTARQHRRPHEAAPLKEWIGFCSLDPMKTDENKKKSEEEEERRRRP